jgi:N utilization substance protein B
VDKEPDFRRAGRRRAFEVLYGLSFVSPEEDDLAEYFDRTPLPEDLELAAEAVNFAWEFVSGVTEHMERLDEIISGFSTHWKLSRIARIELAILRLAIYEMLGAPHTPHKVAINEAVELAKGYGDENSKNFVNGILDAVAKKAGNDSIGLHN